MEGWEHLDRPFAMAQRAYALRLDPGMVFSTCRDRLRCFPSLFLHLHVGIPGKLSRCGLGCVGRWSGGPGSPTRGGTSPAGLHPAQREIVWMCLRWPTLHASATSALLHRAVVVPQRAPSRCPPDLPERGPRSHKRETAPLPAGVLGSGRA